MIVTLSKLAANWFMKFLQNMPPMSPFYPPPMPPRDDVPEVEPIVVKAKRSNKPRVSTLMKKTKNEIKEQAAKKGIKLDARKSKEKMIEFYLQQLDQE